MKKITSKKGIQKIVIAILIVLSFNFAVPNYSQADFGGVLLGPIIDFFAGIGDAILSALQYFMYDGTGGALSTAANATGGVIKLLDPFDGFQVDVDEFKNNGAAAYGMEVTAEDNDLSKVQIDENELDTGWFGLGTYQIPVIEYTPEKIFSNQVPALDVNFINPTDWEDEGMNNKSITQALHSTIANWYIALRNLAIIALLSVLLYVGIRMVISSTAADKAKYKQMLMDWVVALCIVFFLHYIMSFILTLTDIITEGISSSSEIVVQIQQESGDVLEFKTNLTGLTRMQVQYNDLGIRMIYLIFYLALVIYTVMFTWTYVKRAITMAFLTLMAPLVAITYPIDKIADGKAQAFSIWLREFMFNALLQPFHLIIFTIFLGGASQIAASNPIYAILFLAFIIPSEKLLRKMFGFDKSSTAGGMSTAASILGGAAVLNGAKSLIGNVGRRGGSSGGKAKVRTKNPTISSKTPKLEDAFPNSGSANGEADRNGIRTAEIGTNRNGAGMNSTNPNGRGVSLGNGAGGSNGAGNLTGNGSEYMTPSGILMTSRPEEPTTPRQPISQTPQGARIEQQTAQNNRTWTENDTRGMGQWISDNLSNTKYGRHLVNGAKSIRQIPRAIGKIPDVIANKTPGIRNLPKPVRNTIRGAVGTIGKAAASTAKFAGKAAVGATFGLAAGIAGDDLEDVVRYGAMGTALGVTGLPVLGRGISSAVDSARSTYEAQAFGAEAAAIQQQDRELMSDAQWNDVMDKGYESIYGEKPTAMQSREFKESALDYYNSGITNSKDITKSMKFEKELKEQMIANGDSEEEASDRARKQAIVISKLANETNYEQLTNEGKRDDLKNRFIKEFKASGMDEKTATANADSTINLIMKRKGMSPK